MKLIDTSDTLPDARPNRVTFMLDRHGVLQDMGPRPRLTLGERLLGGSRRFYQVDTGQQTACQTFEADSATGRKRFRVHLEVDYKVADSAALVAAEVSQPIDSDATILSALRREVEDMSPDILGKDNQMLRHRIREELDPSRGGRRRIGPFEILRVAARVEPPGDINLPSEADDDIDDLVRRRIAALSRGDKELAANLQEAINALNDLDHSMADETGRMADKIIMITQRIEALIQAGSAPGDPVVRALRQRLRDYAEKGTDVMESDPASKAVADKSDDRGLD